MIADVVSDMPGNHRSLRLRRDACRVTTPVRTASLRERLSVFSGGDATAFLNPSRGYAPAALGMVCLPLVYHWRFIMNQASSNTKSYFDLHTSGIGYLQRVRIEIGSASCRERVCQYV